MGPACERDVLWRAEELSISRAWTLQAFEPRWGVLALSPIEGFRVASEGLNLRGGYLGPSCGPRSPHIPRQSNMPYPMLPGDNRSRVAPWQPLSVSYRTKSIVLVAGPDSQTWPAAYAGARNFAA